jgi:biotin carboxyl carrier protein
MDEEQWLACDNHRVMMHFLHDKASDRKRRLFACACVRRVWGDLADDAGRKGIEAAEDFVDGLLDRQSLEAATAGAVEITSPTVGTFHARGMPDAPPYVGVGSHVTPDTVVCLIEAMKLFNEIPAGCTGVITEALVKDKTPVEYAEVLFRVISTGTVESLRGVENDQVVLVRDVFGNPFRQMLLDPAWLQWQDGTVVKLAQTTYEERNLPGGTLDNVRLAVLADALEEAGCTDAVILDHCRGPGPHVRGCFVVDLILAKE